MIHQEQRDEIRSRPYSKCHLCGSDGEPIHEALEDHVFNAPGRWTMKRCSDPDCGLAWLDPMPVAEDIGKAYQSYYTHIDAKSRAGILKRIASAAQKGYLRRKFGYTKGVGPRWYGLLWPLALLHSSGRHALDSMAMYLPAPGDGARVLDVGCGSGELLASAIEMGWDGYGVDFDPAAVELARSKGLNVDLGDLIEQSYPDDHFDAIHMNHVIEHVYDGPALLGECCRILKPGGKLVVLTPNIDGWGHSLFGGCWRPLEPPRHLFMYSRKSLGSAAESCGFGIERLCGSARYGNGYWARSRQIRRKASGRFETVTLVDKLGGFAFLLAERALLLLRPDVGEELLLIARKPGAV